MTIHPQVHPSHLILRGLPVASVVRGGAGSGFYGHAGRPGEKGGSAPDGGGGGKPGGSGEHYPYGKYPVQGVASHIAKQQAGGGSGAPPPSTSHSGRPGQTGGAKPSGGTGGRSSEQQDAVRLLATGTPLPRGVVNVLEAMDNRGELSSKEHDALDDANVYESGTI